EGILAWVVSESCPWLWVIPPAGFSSGEIDKVVLGVGTSGLTHGYYYAELTVTDPGAENNPQVIDVHLYINNELHVPSAQPTIQAAIDAAIDGDTVIAADGTYTGVGNRDIDFLGKAITVRSANGPESCIIDCQANPWGYIFRRGFLFHSQEGPESVLQGFTIMGGASSWKGGGIFCDDSSPMIINCIITYNEACWMDASVPEAEFNGGGMYNESSNPTLINCIFSNNSAMHYGGGMYNDDSNPNLVNCIFNSNSSDGRGGGIYNNNSDPCLINCTFYGNFTGMYNKNSSPTVNNCIFWDNYDEIVNFGNSFPIVTYCDIKGGWPGAGNIDADPMFETGFHLQAGSPCIDAGNNSAVPMGVTTDFEGDVRIQGGTVDMGIDETPYDLPEVTVGPAANVTTNSATLHGTLTDMGTEVNLEVYFVYGIEPGEYPYSTQPQIMTSTGPFSADIIDLHNGAEHFYRAAVVFDPNRYGGKESFTTINVEEIIFVDDDNSGTQDGYSWVTAYADFQDALGVSASGDQIWVAAGTYKPTRKDGGTHERHKTFQMKNEVAIYGGFAGTEEPNTFDLADRDFSVNETILDGENDTTGARSYHIFYHPEELHLDISAILDGFTITRGRAYGSGAEELGGGMYNNNCSPTIRHCIFLNNQGEDGGGMYNDESHPTVSYCSFINNRTSSYGQGGGMHNDHSQPNVSYCLFKDNQADRGGGMINDYFYTTIHHCTFENNRANRYNGGGVTNKRSNIVFSDCLFLDNYAIRKGGGLYFMDCNTQFLDCDFHDNRAELEGGGVHASNDGGNTNTVTLNRCHFEGNWSDRGGGYYGVGTFYDCTFCGNESDWDGGGMYGSGTISHCTFSNNTSGSGGGYYGSGIISYCTFTGNLARRDGGGIYYPFNSVTISHCYFNDNTANRDGG
ncbi:choice-of-anchor Q domain-containing protein, partial [Planctomycetota bacterium]